MMNPSATKESTRICVNRPYLQGEVIEEPQVVQLAVKYGLLSGAGANMSCPLVSQEKMSKTQWMLWLRDHPENRLCSRQTLSPCTGRTPTVKRFRLTGICSE